MTSVSNRWLATTVLATTMGLMTPGAFAITIGGGGDAREVDLAQTYDFSAAAAATAPTYIVARGTPKGVAKVGIASFCLSVVDGRSVSGSSGPYTASAASAFPGTLDPQQLAAVASDYRNEFVAALRAAGIEVLEHEALAALPSYQKLAEKMTSDSFRVDDSYELGKGTWANNQVQVVSAGSQPILKDCRKLNLGSAMSFGKAPYQKDLDGITLLVANVTLDFAKAKAAGGFFRGAKADLDYGQYIVPGIDHTTFAFFNKVSGGNLWLKQAIVAAQNPFAEGAKGDKTTETKMDNEYDIESASTRTTSQATAVSADMDLWYANSRSLLKALSGMLAETLKASR